MRIAACGFISDGTGSGAGAFSLLLRTLLEQGHEVTMYGIERFTEPKSLNRYANYRFVPLRVQAVSRVNPLVRKLGIGYLASLQSTVSHLAYQREAMLQIGHARAKHDVAVGLDEQNLWPGVLPVISWPQSPPQSEWSALFDPAVSKAVRESSGRTYLAAVHAYRAYRWTAARLALGFSTRVICASRWAHTEWLRFGLPEERASILPYPIDLSPFARARCTEPGRLTLLWLGRAVPRKRLDLFLETFELLAPREPTLRARLVGNFSADPGAMRLLARFRGDARVSIEPPVARADVPLVLASADVLVQTSQKENFGFSVAEALAAGCPVVVGPTNGTADYCGEASFEFSEHSPASIAEAIGRALAALRADREAVERRARAAAFAHFAPTGVATRFLDIAEQAIAQAREPPKRRSGARH